MRTPFGSITSLLVMLVAGCNTVDPDECWVNNTSGGFGDDGPIPIGAGVGATSSGDFPGGAPLDYGGGGEANPCMAGRFVYFKPSDFPFVTTVHHDGPGPGGYQQAKCNLEFYDFREEGAKQWHCPFTIGMPLRTEHMGKISAIRAANLSVEITEAVAADRETNFELPSGIFCEKFIINVNKAFKETYPYLGASAVKK
ncbi:hypothetical protein [Polyangium spumosum]|uniref:Uncharacterized protein n=1 Tax=Polyangium spumosum TaxID=889282 RepID=A0A6N7PVA3_9BACT|nr:hypothetical protein [Polyangium spumosum]MRG94004.1 hypothetical protein [Polyangium spumosum]